LAARLGDDDAVQDSLSLAPDALARPVRIAGTSAGGGAAARLTGRPAPPAVARLPLPLPESRNAMDRKAIEARLTDPEQLDYGIYLNADRLLACQKPWDDLVNGDELQFMIVHQVEELWMKLMAATLLDADAAMAAKQGLKALSLLQRVHVIQRLMTAQLDLIETMSPKAYQQIRLMLGNGSGQESPGFRVLLEMPPHMWATYREHWLEAQGRSVRDVYDTGFAHDEAYLLAEALLEFDEQFQKFRASHIHLVNRSIGLGSKSIKGRPVDLLNAGARHRFFPELWNVRGEMTDAWGASHGTERPSLADGEVRRRAPGHGHG